MKKNFLQSYTVQCRTKTELKTMNQIPKSPLRMSSLGVVRCSNEMIPDSNLIKSREKRGS